MIGVLGDHHVGDGRLRRQAALDQPRRRRRLDDARPRRRGRRTWAAAPPAPGTGPARCPAARRRPRRSGEDRPSSTGRSCPRRRRWSRSGADAPAASRGSRDASQRASQRGVGDRPSRPAAASSASTCSASSRRQLQLVHRQASRRAAEAMALHLLDDLSAAGRLRARSARSIAFSVAASSGSVSVERRHDRDYRHIARACDAPTCALIHLAAGFSSAIATGAGSRLGS